MPFFVTAQKEKIVKCKHLQFFNTVLENFTLHEKKFAQVFDGDENIILH